MTDAKYDPLALPDFKDAPVVEPEPEPESHNDANESAKLIAAGVVEAVENDRS